MADKVIPLKRMDKESIAIAEELKAIEEKNRLNNEKLKLERKQNNASVLRNYQIKTKPRKD